MGCCAGLGRVLATGAVDYQSHASEYGVHWNFFLTLAALRLLSMLLPWAASSAAVAAAVGAAVLAAHQRALGTDGQRGSGGGGGRLIDYVHSDERGSGLLEANKEGLLSLPGYWALQLVATAAGHAVHRLASALAAPAAAAAPAIIQVASAPAAAEPEPRAENSGFGGGLRVRIKPVVSLPPLPPEEQHQLQQEQQERSWPAAYLLPLLLAAGAAALWLVYWAAATQLQPVSRRACNATYVLWMLALNVQCLALFVAADALLPGAMPRLLLALNDNMLPVFLLGNVLTGLVNMAVDTLAAGDAQAVAAVTLYAAGLCAAAVLASEWRPGGAMLRTRS